MVTVAMTTTKYGNGLGVVIEEDVDGSCVVDISDEVMLDVVVVDVSMTVVLVDGSSDVVGSGSGNPLMSIILAYLPTSNVNLFPLSWYETFPPKTSAR